MHIIIDGYNLIRQSDLRRFDRSSLENGRTELIRTLAVYKKKRGHRITVVFDGTAGESISEERDRSAGINIVFSRRGETANDVIKRMLRTSSESTIVITSDREIISAASRSGSDFISSAEFAVKLRDAQFETAFIGKFDSGNPEEKGVSKKKGPAKRASHRERSRLAHLKKL